jgi:hypothetical protein
MADDRSAGARLVRIDDLRRCLASAFERLDVLVASCDSLGAPAPAVLEA